MPSQEFQVSLDCFLWDLVDEGVDTVLDRIKGETGVTGIVVPVDGPALRQLRPHAGVSPRSLRVEGGAHFQPDLTRYAGTRLRPPVAKWLHKSNPIRSVIKGCREKGLQIGGHITLGAHAELAERFEHAIIRDVFGDGLTWLCPANPDVQEYVRALLNDLAESYAFDHIRLSAIGFPVVAGNRNHAIGGHEQTGFGLGPLEAWLRSLCFCASCRQLSQREGVDIEAVARLVSQTLERSFQTGQCATVTLNQFVQDHASIEAFLTWRSAQMQAWVRSLHRACRCRLILSEHQDSTHSGIDLAGVAEAADMFCYTAAGTTAEEVDTVLHRLPTAIPTSRIGVWVSAGAECPDHDSLVACLSKIAKAGCDSAWIGNYGTIPLSRLEWIRQAVRFARRESL